MAEERLIIIVQADGTRQVKRELEGLGTAGDQSAKRISASLKNALKDAAYNARVAMNSWKHVEAEKVRAARAAQAELLRIQKAGMAASRAARQAELRSMKAALKAETAATRAAAREQTNIARAQRRAAVTERKRQRTARTDATFGLGNFGSVLGLIGIKESISGFISLSDSMMNVQNRLAIVTNGSEDLSNTINRLKNISLASRAEFDLTTRTYARLAQSTKMLNITQGANISMTETLTKAIAVSGATGAEAHATLIQLSQAMASNRLSADEFRSVAEQLPIILDLLADSTKRPRQELKEMGQEGKLTARAIALAILEGHDKIEQMFAKTKPTIMQSWENIRTQARFAVDAFNQATGAGEKLVDALQWIANNMSTVTVVVKLLANTIGTYLVVQIYKAAAGMAVLAMSNPWTAAAVGLGALISLVVTFRKEISETVGDWGYFAGVMATPASLLTDEQKEAVRSGRSPMKAKRDDHEWSASQAEMNRNTSDSYMEKLERMNAINKLRSDADPIKKKKGRHVATFGEAIQDLLQENMLLRVNEARRERLNVVLDIQAKIQRQMTQGELKIVQGLHKQIQFRKMLEEAQKAAGEEASRRYEEDTKNIVEMKKEMEEAREEARKFYIDQLKLENLIHAGTLSGISSESDLKNARRTVVDMKRGGRLGGNDAYSALQQLELNDPSTNPIRKLFLEETTGVGKFSEQINGLFGTEGTLVKGFADATANSLVFGQSFKRTIHDLAQQVQAELISTLIQSFIRMAALGAMGGGEVSLSTVKSLSAIGAPKSAGGYAEGGRASIAGYHHGGEYVVNAVGTQQNRGLLDVINKGGKVNTAGGGGAGGGGGLKVTFIDQAGVSIETKQLTEREVQIIARREVNKEAPRVIAGSLADKNSRVNKSLRTNTTARTQR